MAHLFKRLAQIEDVSLVEDSRAYVYHLQLVSNLNATQEVILAYNSFVQDPRVHVYPLYPVFNLNANNMGN